MIAFFLDTTEGSDMLAAISILMTIVITKLVEDLIDELGDQLEGRNGRPRR